MIKAEHRHLAPDALINTSAVVPIEQRTPHTKVFDPEEFANATKPRVEPPSIRQLTSAELIAEKFPRWTGDDLESAIAYAGFPKATSSKSIGASRLQNALWGAGERTVPTWNEEQVDQWIARVKSLRLC